METDSTTNATQQFEIERLYVKEQACKVFYSPAIFSQIWKPDIHLEIDAKQETLEADRYEVVLLVNVTARNQDRTAITIEVKQAGIFKIAGLPNLQIQALLKGHCPTILYPYARKVVADAALNAGFPPIILMPINFEGLYQKNTSSTDLPKNGPGLQPQNTQDDTTNQPST